MAKEERSDREAEEQTKALATEMLFVEDPSLLGPQVLPAIPWRSCEGTVSVLLYKDFNSLLSCAPHLVYFISLNHFLNTAPTFHVSPVFIHKSHSFIHESPKPIIDS